MDRKIGNGHAGAAALAASASIEGIPKHNETDTVVYHREIGMRGTVSMGTGGKSRGFNFWKNSHLLFNNHNSFGGAYN